MKKRIVFINQATGYLTIDIINEFAREYDEIALITGSIRIQNRHLNPKVLVSGIVRYNRGNNLWKGVSWIIGTLQVAILLTIKYRSFERIFFTIPPTITLLAPLFKMKYSIVVYDLYPDAMKIHNHKESGLVYRLWAARNKRIFGGSHRVFTLSDNMRRDILAYVPDCDVRVVANWTAFTGYIPVPKSQNAFVLSEGISEKFVIQYSGNIGATHNVETIIEVASGLTMFGDIEFQIIGRGDRTGKITELIKEQGLSNCRLLPFRRDEDLFESLCSADIAIVTLDKRTPDVSVPSKVYNLMAAGVPILAIASKESALAGIIREHALGEVFEMNNLEGIKEYILRLKEDRDLRNSLAFNALKASESYTDRNAGLYLNYYLD